MDPKDNKNHVLWTNVWLAAIRTIWDQRNNLVFNGGQILCKMELVELIKFRAWQWNKAKVKDLHASLYEWSSNVRVVMQQKDRFWCCNSYFSLINMKQLWRFYGRRVKVLFGVISPIWKLWKSLNYGYARVHVLAGIWLATDDELHLRMWMVHRCCCIFIMVILNDGVTTINLMKL